ncbi:MAG TPA: hypothetical protein VKU83_03215 [Puia sp.]|nr:hypothetical protein [Puia sp.]
MRTSIKLFLGSMGLLGAGLLAYDLQLNAAFRKADYTQPFYNYVPLDFRDFDRIRLNSAASLNIYLVKGDYHVKLNPRMADLVKLQKEGGELVITAHFPDRVNALNYALYISCPTLKGIETSGEYYFRNQLVDTHIPEQLWYEPTVMKGFRVDSLQISEKDAGTIVLQDDRIGVLRAMVGAGSSLRIDAGNVIGGGDIAVLNKGQLTLKDTTGLNINHHLADSATLILSGEAAKKLLKLH